MRYTFQSNPLFAVALIAGAFAASPAAEAANSPVGVWLDDKGRGAIEIKQCGKTLCGHVVWVKDTKDKKGCGRKMIGKVRKVGSSTWDGGWIYSPERRKTYDVELRPLNNGNLRVTGYAGTKLFSRTMIWKPAPDDLVRCGEEPQIEAKPKVAPAPATVAETQEETTEETVSKSEELPEATATAKEQSQSDVADTEIVDGEGAETDQDAVASNDTFEDDDSEGPPTAREKGLDLGELGLDKFLKRTKSGKCKLDLPWVKVDFDCNR